MKPVSPKQQALISQMELLLNVKFTGTTTVEASQFISRNMSDYIECQEISFAEIYDPGNYED